MYKKIRDESQQKFDADVRRWIFIQHPEIFDPKEALTQKEVQVILDSMWTPLIEGATVCNNFYLRFPDLSPLFATCSIQTYEMFYEYVKVRVHCCLVGCLIKTSRSNLRRLKVE